MSKWGIEEMETINAIKKVGFSGNVLNIAAGDGRFNNKILEVSDTVLAIDIDEKELEILEKSCPKELKKKLQTQKVNIINVLPFENEMFEGIFCTGTLHLFEKGIVIKIIKEIKRVLKSNGRIVIDFATNIERFDKNNQKVVFEKEGNYSTEEAIDLFQKELSDFEVNIEVSTFMEENLDDNAGYQFIKGEFLVISGVKK